MLFLIYCVIKTFESRVKLGTLIVSQIEEMSEWEGLLGSEIEVKGFLYQTEEGRWILADRPGLKSCCLEKDKKFIVLDGPLEGKKTSRPVALRGTFSLSSQEFHLSHPVLLDEPSDWSMAWIFAFPMALGCGVYWIGRKWR